VLRALLSGLAVTAEVAALSSLLGSVVACIAGVARSSRSLLVRIVSGGYIELFRGTSAIVQLYFAFYVLPLAGITLTPIVAGTVVLGLVIGAYGAEIVRGGLAAVPPEQTDAAIVLGMRPWMRLRRVLVPQALVTILPPVGNLLIDLVKATSLLSLISISDLAYQAESQRQLSGGGASLSIYGITMLMYFGMSLAITAAVRGLERRVAHSSRPTTVAWLRMKKYMRRRRASAK
jgi:polar amino acid transport system permease protein